MAAIFAFILYASFGIFIGGLMYQIWVYWQTPAPLKIPITPAPVTQSGVVLRLFLEVVLFASLFKQRLTHLQGVFIGATFLNPIHSVVIGFALVLLVMKPLDFIIQMI